MEKSIFIEVLDKYMPKLKTIVETFNGKRKQAVCLFKSMLREEYSADMKWESNSINTTIVAADVVAMDSDLPLKKRNKLQTANGDLPKIGMKMKLGEKQITDINIMRARGVEEATIVGKLLNDAVRCTNGIDERIEAMFLTGLSDGVTLVADADNIGTGIRVDFGYLDENKFGVVTKWGESGYAPISDIKRVLEKSRDKGDSISVIALSREAYDLIRNSTEGKELAAIYGGLVITSNVSLPVPTPKKFDEAFKDETGVVFMLIDRTISVEKNGAYHNTKPWNRNKLIFLTSTEVGKLVYGTLAEESNPITNVKYQKTNKYCLVKKYFSTEPYGEITASQAIVLPVIENVEQIYMLSIDEAQVVDSVQETADSTDVYVTVWGRIYEKAQMTNALGIEATSTDSAILNKINRLSEKDEKALKALFPTIDKSKLEFTAAADATGKTVTVSSKGTVTATSSESFCTVAVSSGVVTATVSANESIARTAIVTITQNSKNVIVYVSQAAAS
ncbi:MAG: BACON domain-containing protein [Paludibacteraceae bacterium]|nr:BACON domain-containing protein [Paludibacteraceae bacterium]